MCNQRRAKLAESDVASLLNYGGKVIAAVTDALALEPQIPFSGNIRLAVAEWEAFVAGRETRADDEEGGRR